jgi:5S rRNA maturation endonuclease (ribonuclease M5)
VNRDEILAVNPLPDYLRNRGFSLYAAGSNLVTNACPIEEHQKLHRCVTVDTAQGLWHCNDHARGGTIIDWEALEKKITPAEAMRQLSGGSNGANPPATRPQIVATHDYVDEAGKLVFQCVRQEPKDFKQRRPDDNGGWIWNLQGVRRVLYHLPEVIAAQTICIAEGEKDADNLAKLGFTATTNPLGAGKWRDEYSETLRGKIVFVFGDVGDPDQKGERHTEHVIESLTGIARSIKRVQLPDGFHDVSDFIKSFSSPDEAKTAIEKLIAPQKTAVAEQPRVAQVEPPQTPVTLTEWRDEIAKNFPSLARPAEICLSVEAQLLLNDVVNPFALALVDVPASGKTITLNFFKNPEELAYTTDYFSAAAFVSHATNVRREELANVDLLPRIRFKTAIVRELNSILGAKEDDLIKSLGILTRVLDGEGLQTDSGVHGRRGYNGDYTFMLLAGTTPIQPRVFKVMGNFGSRLFFLSLRSPDADNKELIALNRGKDRKLKENECRKITENFLRTLWSAHPQGVDWDKGDDTDDCLEVIANCARLLASLRGAINVFYTDDGGEKLSHTVPVIEKPHRINCLFANLARAHALICGRRQLSEDDLWPVLEITFDSAPPSRAKIFRLLIEKGGRLSTSDVENLLRCSAPTARKEMEALSVLGVVDKWNADEAGRPDTIITLAESFSWFTSDECSSLREPRLGHMPVEQTSEEIRSVFPNATEVTKIL